MFLDISILIIIFISLGIILAWFIIKISKSESSLNKRFEELEKNVKSAITIDEINLAFKELIELENDCWYKFHSNRLEIIRTILQLKFDNYYAKTNFKFDL